MYAQPRAEAVYWMGCPPPQSIPALILFAKQYSRNDLLAGLSHWMGASLQSMPVIPIIFLLSLATET